MPNGKDMLNDLEFEKNISELDDRGLQEFTARQVFECRKDIGSNVKRIKSLEGRSNKALSITGGIGTMIGAAIVAVFNYFANKS